MAILLMVMLVGLMLSGLLVPMVITQARTSQFDSTRVQALNAAEGGVDVSLGTLRAAVTNGIGDSTKLSCVPASGTVAAGVGRYSVVVEYFTANPVSEPYPSSLAMKCVSGYGTFDTATGAGTPGFARITSTGTAGTTSGPTASRTLTSIYVFRTSNLSTLGGLVQIVSSPSTALCMDVGSASAPAGTAVLLQQCSASTPPAASQVFAFRTDLTLQLVSSVTTANPNGLCLNSAQTPAVAGDALKLSQCGALGSPAIYTQQWTYNANASSGGGWYQAAQANTATTGALPNLCLTATQSPGQAVKLDACGSAGWVASAATGPGSAALPQWANYAEFGRCLDVTAENPDSNFMIDYPCKQNPYLAAVGWNQLFQAPAIPAGAASVTGQIVTNNGQKYCLTSPGISGSYVTTRACVAGNALQSWTIYGGDKSLNYSTKYTLVSGSLCLGLGDPNAGWSTVNVDTCAGTKEQKWNAVPNLLTPTLSNIREK